MRSIDRPLSPKAAIRVDGSITAQHQCLISRCAITTLPVSLLQFLFFRAAISSVHLFCQSDSAIPNLRMTLLCVQSRPAGRRFSIGIELLFGYNWGHVESGQCVELRAVSKRFSQPHLGHSSSAFRCQNVAFQVYFTVMIDIVQPNKFVLDDCFDYPANSFPLVTQV